MVPGAGGRARGGRGRFVFVEERPAAGATASSCSSTEELPGAKGDDATLGIVGGNANGYAVARHHLDPESPHTPAQLRQHFVTGVHLHAVQTTTVHSDHRALHVNEIILAHS
jgi:hypothetical protein